MAFKFNIFIKIFKTMSKLCMYIQKSRLYTFLYSKVAWLSQLVRDPSSTQRNQYTYPFMPCVPQNGTLTNLSVKQNPLSGFQNKLHILFLKCIFNIILNIGSKFKNAGTNGLIVIDNSIFWHYGNLFNILGFWQIFPNIVAELHRNFDNQLLKK